MSSKINTVQQRILKRIVERKTPERQFLPSIRELEPELTSCRQTIHLALRELVEAGVLEALPRRGFRVRNAGLAAGLFHASAELQIAFVLPRWIEKGIQSSMFSEILNGAEAAGFPGQTVNLVYFTLPWSANERNFSLERLAFPSRRISGAMLVGPTPDFIAEQFIAKCSVPVVLIDNQSDLESTICVTQDNLGGAARAVRYLHEHGHRRIGMISVKPRKMRLNERMAGFYAEMHRLGLAGQIAFIEETDWDGDTVSGGEDCARRLLRDGLNGASAILALNDHMAFGAMRVFQEAGMRIPADLSIMAIGRDAQIAEFCSPQLSTMCCDPRRLGELGLEALLERIRNPDAGGRHILLNMTLCEGGSVGPVPARSA